MRSVMKMKTRVCKIDDTTEEMWRKSGDLGHGSSLLQYLKLCDDESGRTLSYHILISDTPTHTGPRFTSLRYNPHSISLHML